MFMLEKKYYSTPLYVATNVPAVFLAAVFLYFSAILLGSIVAAAPVGNYASPDFPGRAASENTLVSLALLLCACALVYSIIRPLIGGVVLVASVVILGFALNAFNVSTALYPTRGAVFFPSWSAVSVLVLLLGLLFVLRGSRDKHRQEEETEPTE